MITALLAVAVACEVVCVAGVLLSATTFDRIHYAGSTTAVAPFLVFAAVVIRDGHKAPSWSAGFVAFALFTLNSTLMHATARVARLRALEAGEL